MSDDFRRVMVDIETLGLEPGAAIVSIGAAEFGVDGLGERESWSVDLQSCEDAGLSIDGGTLEWWLDQDETAREQLTGGEPLLDSLVNFSAWIHSADEVWANSPAFDCDHLEHAADAVGVELPWHYYERRDYRTLRELEIAPDIEQDGTEHDALDDAVHQARVASATLRKIARLAGGDSDA
jgi:DNA polymerase III epsilon subunit-like protein